MKVLQTSALPLGYGALYNILLKRKGAFSSTLGADYEARTRYLHLGKVALYQMSYARIMRDRLTTHGASGRNRTNDTGIFSPLLYRLSYRGKCGDLDGARTHDL